MPLQSQRGASGDLYRRTGRPYQWVEWAHGAAGPGFPYMSRVIPATDNGAYRSDNGSTDLVRTRALVQSRFIGHDVPALIGATTNRPHSTAEEEGPRRSFCLIRSRARSR